MLSGDAQANPAAGHEADKLAALRGRDWRRQCRQCAVCARPRQPARRQRYRSFLRAAEQRAERGLVAAAVAESRWPTDDRSDCACRARTVRSNSIRRRRAASRQRSRSPSIKASRSTAAHSRSGLTASAASSVFVPIAPAGSVTVSGDSRPRPQRLAQKNDGALVIGSDALGVTLSIGELGIALQLKNGDAALRVLRSRRQGDDQAVRRLPQADSRRRHHARARRRARSRRRRQAAAHQRHRPAREPAGADPADRSVRAAADQSRARSGQGGSFTHLAVEVSASFGVTLGPFAASVDRLGVLLELDLANGGTPDRVRVQAAERHRPRRSTPASSRAAAISAVDAERLCRRARAEDARGRRQGDRAAQHAFGGRLLAAAADLRTVPGNPALVRLHADRRRRPDRRAAHGEPAGAVAGTERRLSSTPCCSPRIRWPTRRRSSTRCARCSRSRPAASSSARCSSSAGARRASSPCGSGCSSRPISSRCSGRRSSQLPPLVSADLALLYLRLDFVGSVVFDPLQHRVRRQADPLARRVHFDLRAVRVPRAVRRSARRSSSAPAASIRASRKYRPTFPRHSIASARASTSASSASRSRAISRSLRRRSRPAPSCACGPISASPASRAASASTRSATSCRSSTSKLDIFAYLDVHVFGIDFASIHLDGSLAGPGRWRIAGNAKVHTPWPLPDFSLHIDESLRHRPRYAANHRRCRRPARARRSRSSPTGARNCPTAATSFLTPRRDRRRAPIVLAHPLGTPHLPAEARAVRAAPRQGERQQDQRRERVLRRCAAALRRAAAPCRRRSRRRRCSDFFAAAQFLEMSQDDRLAKPSFEIVHRRATSSPTTTYEMGEILEETLRYEEADLGAGASPGSCVAWRSMHISRSTHR